MQTLTILGTSVRAAVMSASQAGYAPYAIDEFADRDTAAICPAKRVNRLRDFGSALAAAPDGPWMYAGGLENHPRLVDQLGHLRPLLGNDGTTLRRVRRNALLAEVATAVGCGFPSRRFDASSSERWLIKRRKSGGGMGIRFLEPAEPVPKSPRFYVQRFIDGDSASAVFVAAGGRAVLLGATRQLLGRDFGLKARFAYCGSIGPLPLTATETTRLHNLGNHLAKGCQLRGLFNVDFIRGTSASGTQLWPLEVNPRYSASVEVLERATDSSFVNLHVETCTSGQLPVLSFVEREQFFGKAIVYARTETIVPATLDAIVGEWDQAGQQPAIADLPQIGDLIRAGQPVVTVFGAGSSLIAVEDELRRRVAAIENLLSAD